ncbi:MAG TPA: hypothetical protein DCE42_23790 [Myxococcales bacterium]|nr:hypothetical protein [Myxococcales bacterium]
MVKLKHALLDLFDVFACTTCAREQQDKRQQDNTKRESAEIDNLLLPELAHRLQRSDDRHACLELFDGAAHQGKGFAIDVDFDELSIEFEEVGEA